MPGEARAKVRAAALALLLLAAPTVAAAPLLVTVVPDLPGSASGDDGFAVGAVEAADLTGWSVDDGEGTWTFPAGTRLEPGVPLWVAGDLAAWKAHDGTMPALDAGPSRLRLGNDGDDLTLRDPGGAPVDSFAYGQGADALDAPQSAGLVLMRMRDGADGGWRDTDAPSDWQTPRMHRVGESALDRPTFEAESLTLYASPDSSFEVLTGLVAGARERLHLNVYELRSAELVDALVAAKAAHPALDLQVLVDGNPAGMTSDERHATAAGLLRIQQAGGRVVLPGNGRYDDHHLKVLVADATVAVQSENWVASGVPADPTWGNRGWGIAVHDAAAADWFAAWMQADRDAWDSVAFDVAAFDPLFEASPRFAARSGEHQPVPSLTVRGAFRVTPVVAPDHTQDPANEPVSRVAAAARDRLWVQQLDLSLRGSNRLGWAGDDPLTQAIAAAAGAGAVTRVQAAAPFAADDTGNAEALAWLEERGAAAQVFADPGFSVLHNKGLVADDVVVVGSMNGNLHSRAQNREVALVVEGKAAADYFAGLAQADWDGRGVGRDWSVPVQDLRGLPPAPWPILFALVAVASALARRWS